MRSKGESWAGPRLGYFKRALEKISIQQPDALFLRTCVLIDFLILIICIVMGCPSGVWLPVKSACIL